MDRGTETESGDFLTQLADMQVCLVEPLGTARVPEYPEAPNSAPNEGHPLELFFQSEVEGSVLESTSSWLFIEYMFYVT